MYLREDTIKFLEEECERRNASAATQWTWRELAWVRAQIMLEDWVEAERKRLAKEAKAIECTCGADRTGPSAEAHDDNCPQALPVG